MLELFPELDQVFHRDPGLHVHVLEFIADLELRLYPVHDFPDRHTHSRECESSLEDIEELGKFALNLHELLVDTLHRRQHAGVIGIKYSGGSGHNRKGVSKDERDV